MLGSLRLVLPLPTLMHIFISLPCALSIQSQEEPLGYAPGIFKGSVRDSWFDRYTKGLSDDQLGVWKWAHYFAVYERHLTRFRGTDVHVMECGVASGGSLKMWRDFFGPLATLYGVDKLESVKAYAGKEKYGNPAMMFAGQLSNPLFREQVLRSVKRIDIFLDDANHVPETQIAHLNAILPILSWGGVYLVEDIESDRQSKINFQRYIYDTFLDGSDSINWVEREPLKTISWAAYYTKKKVMANMNISLWQRSVESVNFYSYVVVIEKKPSRTEAMQNPVSGRMFVGKKMGGKPKKKKKTFPS